MAQQAQGGQTTGGQPGVVAQSTPTTTAGEPAPAQGKGKSLLKDQITVVV